MSKVLAAFFDGACDNRKAERPMGYGWYFGVLDASNPAGVVEIIQYDHVHVPDAPGNSSNVAEYLALRDLLRALTQYCTDAKERPAGVRIYGDSQLVVNQVCGRWQVRSEGLVGYADSCWTSLEALRIFQGITVFLAWVPRNKNRKADELSKAGLLNISR